MGFCGFPPEALSFYEGLEADNSKAYWEANRPVYDQCVRAPMQALVDDLPEEYQPMRLFRPYRDVRFAKDKTPYKTAVAAAGESDGGAVHYVQLSAAGLLAASGYYQAAADQLERMRVAIADDTSGAELVEHCRRLERSGYIIGGEALRTAPRGYPRDHPRIRFLRHKGITMSRQFAPEDWLHTPGALDRVVEVWRAAADLNGWLDRHVGPSTLPPPEPR